MFLQANFRCVWHVHPPELRESLRTRMQTLGLQPWYHGVSEMNRILFRILVIPVQYKITIMEWKCLKSLFEKQWLWRGGLYGEVGNGAYFRGNMQIKMFQSNRNWTGRKNNDAWYRSSLVNFYIKNDFSCLLLLWRVGHCSEVNGRVNVQTVCPGHYREAAVCGGSTVCSGTNFLLKMCLILQIHEAANIAQKLSLIAQELPSERYGWSV